MCIRDSLNALKAAGITTIGKTLDKLAQKSDRKFIDEVADFGVKGLEELKLQMRAHGYSAGRWPATRLIETTPGRVPRQARGVGPARRADRQGQAKGCLVTARRGHTLANRRRSVAREHTPAGRGPGQRP